MNRNWILTLVIVIALATGSYGVFFAMRDEPLAPGFYYGNGHVEGVEVRVTAEVTGRILENQMVEGQRKEQGQLLLRLDTEDLDIQLAGAQAEKRALVAQLKGVQAAVESWRHHRNTATAELERIKKLRAGHSASQVQLDRAENEQREATAQLESRLAQLEALTAQIEVVGHRVELIRSQLDKTRITAPIAGTILIKGAEGGEVVSPGQIIAVMVDLSRMELKVYLPEADIGKIKLGDPARIRVDAFADKQFDGRVERVDAFAQFTPRAVHMPDERVRMVFGVTLAVDNPDGFLKPGMPADAWLRWDPAVPWPGRLAVPGR